MSTIVIRYDGNDITNNVIFSTATFESQLGAVPGTFRFVVLDRDNTMEFHTGREISLDIDGQRYFGGFVLQVTMQLGLPVDLTDNLTEVESREYVLQGVDYNILFDKRIIYNKSNPVADIPPFSTSLTDKQVLALLFDNYMDVGGLGLDLDTYVEAVGDVTPSGAQGAFAIGEYWRKQMEEFASLTGAIWYFDAEKNLHYQDREDVTALFEFSDQPDGATTYGFRDFTYTDDATNVINDALVWGGSPFGSTGVTAETVFGRATDNNAITAVGRWQKRELHFGEAGYFETADVERRANLIVYGDPNVLGDPTGAEIGLRRPQKQARLTWFSDRVPGPLVPGTVVTLHLNTFGFDVDLPLRSVRISFPTTEEAKFDGFFGIQTSDPWSLWKLVKKVSTETTGGSSANVPVVSDGSQSSTVTGTRVRMMPSPDPDGVETDFEVADIYFGGSMEVFLNGLQQRSGVDYDEDPANKLIIFTTAPLDGDQIWVNYYATGA